MNWDMRPLSPDKRSGVAECGRKRHLSRINAPPSWSDEWCARSSCLAMCLHPTVLQVGADVRCARTFHAALPRASSTVVKQCKSLVS